MKIILNNFRKYDHKVIEIEDHKSTLIQGKSGAGKSTFLDSIHWCLYGYSTRKVYPHNGNKKTNVTIEYKDYVIYRQKSPELLKVEYEGRVYQDEQAQGIIDEMFGNRTVFSSSSYMVQRVEHVLISGSNNDKLKFLRGICFPDEDPEILIEKTKLMIREVKKLLAIDYAVLETLETEYESEDRIPDFSYDNSQDEIQNMKLEVESLESEIQKLELDFAKQEKDKIRFNILNSELEKLKEEYEILKEFSDQKLSILEENYEKYVDFLRQKSELEKINQELSELSDDNLIFTQDDLTECRKLETIYKHNKDLADSINMKYSSKEIRNNIKDIEEKLKWKSYFEEYNQLKVKEPDFSKDEISERLENAKNQRKIYSKNLDLSKKLRIRYDPDLILKYQNRQIEARSSKEKYEENERELKSIPKFSKKPKFYTEEEEESERIIEREYNNQSLFLKSLGVRREDLEDEIRKLENIEEMEVFRIRDNAKLACSVEECPSCSAKLSYDGKLVKSDGVINQGSIKYQVAKYHETSDLNIAELSLRKEKLKNIKLVRPSNLEKIVKSRKKYSEWEERERLESEQEILKKNMKYVRDDQVFKLEYVQEPEDIEELKRKLSHFQKWERKLELKEILKDKSEESWKKLERNLNKMKKIEYVKKPKYESEYIQSQIKIQNLKQKRDGIILIDVDEIRKEEIYSYSENLNRGKEVMKRIQEIENEDFFITDIEEDDILERKEKHKELKIKIDESSFSRKMKEKLTKIDGKKDIIKRRENTLIKLKELKKFLCETESQVLENIIYQINSTLDDNLKHVFDDPISVTIKTSKKLKSSKRNKIEIFISVIYNGNEYLTIFDMSPGERDRVGVVLMLTVNKIIGNKILMMDEIFSGVDPDQKIQCIESVWNVVNDLDSTVIISDHFPQEEFFDNFILFD